MPNSSITIQDVVDEVAVIGDLTPVLRETGGYASQPALNIANAVMKEMLSYRFPWKWNRTKIPAFTLTPLQQDYASVNIYNIGWLENGARIDINNTQVPPPLWRITAVRDLEIDHSIGGYPFEFCWFNNSQLEFVPWPGPGTVYTNPIGPNITNNNQPTSIQLADGTICILTQYGTTGTAAPTVPAWTPPTTDPYADPPANYPAGVVIQDGTAQWTCCDPNAQGLRFTPRPPSGGIVWLVRTFAQMKPPPKFTSLKAYIDPIPDDYSKWFTDGFIAYTRRYSSNPAVQAKFEPSRQIWLEAMAAAARQGDREDESKGFYPDHGVMAPTFIHDAGPFPYRWIGVWR